MSRPTKKLYLVSYSTISAVVCAPSPELARKIHPIARFNVDTGRTGSIGSWVNDPQATAIWPTDPSLITVQYIGDAAPGSLYLPILTNMVIGVNSSSS